MKYSYKLVAIKLTMPGTAHLEKHCQCVYILVGESGLIMSLDEDLSQKPFFPGLVKCAC